MNILRAIIGFLTSLASRLIGAARRGRVFRYDANVERWRDVVLSVLDETDMSCSIDVSTVLAEIHVETNGRNRHRPGSQYRGLLQVGRAVAKETHTSRAVMGRGGLHGARESVLAYVRWARKYRNLHLYDPELMALGWKGGVGTLKTFRARYPGRAETPLDPPEKLLRWLDRKRWQTWRYVRYFRAARGIWSADDPSAAPAVRVR